MSLKYCSISWYSHSFSFHSWDKFAELVLKTSTDTGKTFPINISIIQQVDFRPITFSDNNLFSMEYLNRFRLLRCVLYSSQLGCIGIQTLIVRLGTERAIFSASWSALPIVGLSITELIFTHQQKLQLPQVSS